MTRGLLGQLYNMCVCLLVCTGECRPSRGARSGASSCDSLLMYSTCAVSYFSHTDPAGIDEAGNCCGAELLCFVCRCAFVRMSE